MQDGMAGAVGGGASALRLAAMAEILGHAAEGAQEDPAIPFVREKGTPQCSSS